MLVPGFAVLKEFGIKEVGDLIDSAVLSHQVSVTTRELELRREQEGRLRFVFPKDKTGAVCIKCKREIAQNRINAYDKNYSTDHFRAVPLRCALCESKRKSKHES